MRLLSKRLWINLTLLIFTLLLFVSGFIIFVTPYNTFLTGLHFWLGLFVVFCVVWHLAVNIKPFKRYLLSKAALVVFAFCGLVFFGLAAGIYGQKTPFSNVINFGKNIRKTAIISESNRQIIHVGELANSSLVIDSNLVSNGNLVIEVRAGEKYRDNKRGFYFGKQTSYPPQFVFWLEDMQGNLLKTLFVTETAGFIVLHPNDKPPTYAVSRPEAFPYWLAKYRKASIDVKVDGLTGATPHGHFDIAAKIPKNYRKFRVVGEVNRSFDFNEYYSRDRYPEDKIYTGNGYPGQPSVVYATDIDLDTANRSYVMTPVGHGHYSGKDGELYSDMTGIDTALQIFDRIIVDINLK